MNNLPTIGVVTFFSILFGLLAAVVPVAFMLKIIEVVAEGNEALHGIARRVDDASLYAIIGALIGCSLILKALRYISPTFLISPSQIRSSIVVWLVLAIVISSGYLVYVYNVEQTFWHPTDNPIIAVVQFFEGLLVLLFIFGSTSFAVLAYRLMRIVQAAGASLNRTAGCLLALLSGPLIVSGLAFYASRVFGLPINHLSEFTLNWDALTLDTAQKLALTLLLYYLPFLFMGITATILLWHKYSVSKPALKDMHNALPYSIFFGGITIIFPQSSITIARLLAGRLSFIVSSFIGCAIVAVIFPPLLVAFWPWELKCSRRPGVDGFDNPASRGEIPVHVNVKGSEPPDRDLFLAGSR